MLRNFSDTNSILPIIIFITERRAPARHFQLCRLMPGNRIFFEYGLALFVTYRQTMNI